MRRLITLLVVITAIGICGFGYQVVNHLMTPDPIKPYLASAGNAETLRYSFIPHWSIVRTAPSWYDRKVELYAYENNESHLVSCTLYQNHYPIFSGEHRIEVKNCM